MSPIMLYLVHPHVGFSSDVNVDELFPLLARRGKVDKHHQALLRMYRLCKFTYDELESMYLE